MDNLDRYVRTILFRAFAGDRRSGWSKRMLRRASVPDVTAPGSDRDAVLDAPEARSLIYGPPADPSGP
jgi:hypothetical protein